MGADHNHRGTRTGALGGLLDRLQQRLAPDVPIATGNGAGQARYRSLVDNLQQVVFQTDQAGAWTFLNPGWQTLTGFSVDEAVGKPLLDYVHPDDRKRWQDYAASLMDGAGAARSGITLRWLRKDGGSRWVEVFANPVPAEHARDSVMGVVGTLNDITPRVKQERQQHASNRMLESLIGHLPGMIYRCRNNENWTMDFVSAGSLELTGYPPEDLINNQTLSYAQLIHVDDRQRVWNEVQSALRNDGVFDLEYRIITAPGGEKWVWERGKAIYSTTSELLALEGYMIDITQAKLTEHRVRHERLYEPVTGLPGAALFMDRLQTAAWKSVSGKHPFILIVLEMDRFRILQNKYGNATMESVAVEISRRLSEVLDPQATLCRLRDYRFGILLEGLAHIKDISRAVAQIQERILLPFVIDESAIYATASIGVAMSSTGYTDGENMLADALTALSRAKALGGGRREVFDLRLHARATAQMQLENELQDAMRIGELSVYWQPIVSLSTKKMAGLEGRLVWRHPRRGLLFAEHFLRRAEDTQVIVPLWEWMLKEACRQMQSWVELEHAAGIAFNVQISGKSLLDVDAVLRLGDYLTAAQLRPNNFALGLPEDVLNQTPSVIQELLQRMRASDIGLVLNDFGAGLSSLSMLKKMPIEMVKLDRALVANYARDGHFIRAITALTHELDISVIADGVDNARQTDALAALGVDYVQGEFISPPVDGATLTSMLEGSNIRLL